MRLPSQSYQTTQSVESEIGRYLPNLSRSQLKGLAMWAAGSIMAESACQNAVASALSPFMGSFNTLRQYLREWLYDGKDRACPSETQLDVERCFEPLMSWVMALWESDRLALALDPTLHGDKVVSIALSVMYRGGAIPVAWHVMPANEKGGWIEPSAKLLRQTAPAVPSSMKVVVMCDRGLASPRLWNQIRKLGWHPLMRYPKSMTFCPDGGTRNTASEMVHAPGQAWIGSGTAFVAKKKQRRATLVVSWDEGQEEAWVLLTDLAPEEVDPGWYGLRFWIELGFKGIKSLGLQWQKTRRTDPDRVGRHWLVLSVSTLLIACCGSRVEDAEALGKSPSNVRSVKTVIEAARRGLLVRRARVRSVLRQGMAWLKVLLMRGRPLWKGLWLLPEAWPGPSPTLAVKYGPDTWKN